MKHKHCEVIKAWADGEIIQFFDGRSKAWIDCIANDPIWGNCIEYRVKPTAIKYKVALMGGISGANYVVTANDESDACGLETHAGAFKRWLTDWQEVEV